MNIFLHLRYLYFLIIFLLCNVISFANDYTVQHFKKSNSILPNVITGLAFGGNGLLYISTQSGVFTFDGIDFTELKLISKPQNRKGLLYSDLRFGGRVLSIAQLNNRLVCLGFSDIGYKLYDLNTAHVGEDISGTLNLGLDITTNQFIEIQSLSKTQPSVRSNYIKNSGKVISTGYKRLYFQEHEVWNYVNGGKHTSSFRITNLNNILKYGDTLFQFDNNIAFRSIIVNGKQYYKRDLKFTLNGKPFNYTSRCNIFYSSGRPYLISNKALYKICRKGVSFELNELFSFPFLDVVTINQIQVTANEKAFFLATDEDGLYFVRKSDFTYFSTKIGSTSSSVNALNVYDSLVFTHNGALINLKSKSIANQSIFFSNSKRTIKTDNGFLRVYKISNSSGLDSVELISKSLSGNLSSHIYADDSLRTFLKKLFISLGVKSNLLTDDFLRIYYQKLKEGEILFPVWAADFNGKIYFTRSNLLYTWDSKLKSIGVTLNIRDYSISFIKALPQSRGLVLGLYRGGLLYSSNGISFNSISFNGYPEFGYVHNIFFDSKNRIWLVTNQGLFCGDTNSFLKQLNSPSGDPYFAFYNYKNGLFLSELNSGGFYSSFKHQSGNYFISGLEGFVAGKLDSIDIKLPHDTISIVNTVIDGLLFNGFKRPESNFESVDFYLQCPPSFNLITPEYEYRILPIDKEWKKITSAKFIRLSNIISYNELTLQLRGRTGLKEADTFIQEYTFRKKIEISYVLLHYFLPIVILVCSIWLLMRVRLRYMRKRNNDLESAIVERTAQLSKINSDLQLKSRQVKFLSSILVHDIKSPLKFINIINKELVSSWDISTNDVKYRLAKDMEMSVGKLLQYVTEFLSWLHLQWSESQINLTDVNVSNVLDNIASFYRTYQERYNNNKILVDSGIGVKAFTDSSLLEILFRNLIDNALKNTIDGVILLKLTEYDSYIEFMCEDNGKGMSHEKIRRLLSLRQTNNEFNEDSFSMGYFFINFLADKLEIKIKIESDIGKGTKVTLLIPKR